MPATMSVTADSLDTTGLDLDAATLAQLLEVDPVAWKGEVELISNHYDFIVKHAAEWHKATVTA